ncbi:MAG: hypothetical protein AB8W37_11275 [Arsenophonus endosymbiont of Dermacentor nuttalli]
MLQQNDVILDSLPPITVIITADEIANKDLAMLRAIQAAHYIDGRRVSEEKVLLQLAQEIELDKQLFQQTFATNKDQPTNIFNQVVFYYCIKLLVLVFRH